MVKNKAHAISDRYSYRYGYSDMFGKAGMEWLKALEFGELDRLMVENHLSLIESINAQIRRVGKAIRKKASQDEDVHLLLSLTGIDVYTVLLLRSEMGHVTRFSDYKKLISWAGLAPLVHQSGSVEYHCAIVGSLPFGPWEDRLLKYYLDRIQKLHDLADFRQAKPILVNVELKVLEEKGLFPADLKLVRQEISRIHPNVDAIFNLKIIGLVDGKPSIGWSFPADFVPKKDVFKLRLDTHEKYRVLL